MSGSDLVLDLLAVHFSEPEVTQNASQLVPVYAPRVFNIIELECILNFVVLIYQSSTMSSDSLLLAPPMPLPFAAFFFPLFIPTCFQINYITYPKLI